MKTTSEIQFYIKTGIIYLSPQIATETEIEIHHLLFTTKYAQRLRLSLPIM